MIALFVSDLSLPQRVAKRHEGVKKQHSALFFHECDRVATRKGGPLAVDEVFFFN